MDSEEAFERGVMLAELLSPQWPVDPFTVVVNNPGEILIGESQGDASPGQAAASDLQSARPEEGLILRMLIGVVTFIGIELWIGFPVAGMLRLALMATTNDVGQPCDEIERLGSVGLVGSQLRAGIENEDTTTSLCQRHGGYAATGS